MFSQHTPKICYSRKLNAYTSNFRRADNDLLCIIGKRTSSLLVLNKIYHNTNGGLFGNYKFFHTVKIFPDLFWISLIPAWPPPFLAVAAPRSLRLPPPMYICVCVFTFVDQKPLSHITFITIHYLSFYPNARCLIVHLPLVSPHCLMAGAVTFRKHLPFTSFIIMRVSLTSDNDDELISICLQWTHKRRNTKGEGSSVITSCPLS